MKGHITKRARKSGHVWQARFPNPALGGTAKIEKTFHRKVDAQAWLVQQNAAYHDGSWADPRRMNRPFREVAEAWRNTWPDRLEVRTIAGYEYMLNKYLLPEFGNRPIQSITREVVQAYVGSLATKHGLSGQSARSVYSALRAAMNNGVQLGIVRHNPCQKIRLPRPRQGEMLYLSADEVTKLANAIEPQYRTLIYVAAYTGLRAGEIAGLTRGDFNPERSSLHVRRAVKDVGGTLHIGDTKTHATRSIALPAFLRDMLVEHLAATTPVGPPESAPIFPSPCGTWLRHRNFYDRFYKPAVRRSLPIEKHGLRFHDLRHTAVAILISMNAPAKAIQARLGHCTIQMTMDRYGHLLPSVEDSLAERLDEMYAAQQSPEPSGAGE